MFFKIIYVFLIFITSCPSIASTNVDAIPADANPCKSQNINNTKKYKLLASIPKEKIYLYAVDWKEEEIKQNGVYMNILLDLKGQQRYFSWSVDTNPSFKPRLILSDINNDEVEELIVIITTGSGTDVNIQEAHIFNPNNLVELRVINPLKIIKQNVRTEITKKSGIVTITINVKCNILTAKAKESSAGFWFDDIYFGNYIKYDVIDNKLISIVGAQVSPSGYIGNIKIDYVFKNNRLELNNITFKKIQNQNMFNWDVK